ncbi:MAG TPA: DUF5908 family protein [Burkholderiales bacterium]|nr:DUF5908 family protein [Burkholderiales bacterium]
MPLIVDEIVISVEVTAAPAGGAARAPGAGASGEERQALLAECVERVLEILERREER